MQSYRDVRVVLKTLAHKDMANKCIPCGRFFVETNDVAAAYLNIIFNYRI